MAALFGLPVPPFPDVIYTRNLTPDETGIAGWTAAMVQTALQDGLDNEGNGLCPPMPAGPMGAFGNMTDQDAIDIGNYLTTIAPVANDIPGECVPPAQ